MVEDFMSSVAALDAESIALKQLTQQSNRIP